MALLTAPFDTNPQRGFVGDATQLASLLLQQREQAQRRLDSQAAEAARVAEAKDRTQTAMVEGALALARRDFEFKQKMALDRATLARQTTQDTRTYDLADRGLKLREPEAAPFVSEPETASPLTPPPGFGASASPAPGMSFEASSPTPGGSISLSATGYHPFDVTNASERRMEGGTVDALGKPIYTLEKFRAGQAPHVTVAVPQGSNLFGKTLTSPDAPGVTFRATDHFGTLGGKKITGDKIDIATDSREGASRLTRPMRFNVESGDSPVRTALRSLSDAQSAGIKVTQGDARQVLRNVASAAATADARADAKAADDPVAFRAQDEAGNLYVQRRSGEWEDGRKPEPGTKLNTIGTGGRQGPKMEWHSDGTVTIGTKVMHYEDGVLVPAYVPKGRKVSGAPLLGSDGEAYSRFDDGSWNTPDGELPEGVSLSKMPGAFEGKRFEFREKTQRATEEHKAFTAVQSDRNFFQSKADAAQKEADKLAGKLNDMPRATTAADRKALEDRVTLHAQQAAEFGRKADEAQAKLDDQRRGIVTPPVAPTPAPAPNVAPSDDKVAVVSPDGRSGRIPRSQLDAALKAGYTQK